MSKITLKVKNPCWKGYKPVGTKKKNGKTVPNCVPEEYRNISRKSGIMTKQAAKAGVKAGVAKMGAKALETGGIRNAVRKKIGLETKKREHPKAEELKKTATKHATRAAKMANTLHNHKPGVSQDKSRENQLRGIVKKAQSLEKMHQDDVNQDRKKLEKSYAKSVNEVFFFAPKNKKTRKQNHLHTVSKKSKNTAKELIDKEIERRKKEREKLRSEELDPKGPLISYKSVNEIAKKHDVSSELIKTQLKMGLEVEKEHTNNESKARAIAMHHLGEDPKYYTKLKKVHVEEAYRMPAKTGNVISVLLTWRGKYFDIQMFFPKLGMPNRKEIEHEIQKIYPDSRLIRYKRKEYNDGEPIIKVNEAKNVHGEVEIPSKNLKKLSKKATKRIDTDVDGDVDHNDPQKGAYGSFTVGPDGKRLYTQSKR